MKLDVSDDDVFQEKTVPSGTMLAGWSLLVRALAIAGPVRPPELCLRAARPR
jgi:hypothetical protein